MESKTCVNCGLVASETDRKCRRCRISFSVYPPQQYSTTPLANPGTGQVALRYADPGNASAYGLNRQQSYPDRSAEPIWREGKKLVMHRNAVLPERCLKCNVPTHGSSLLRKLTWYHPLLNLLVFAGPLIFDIVVAMARKSASVDLSLCRDHIKKHRIAVLITWMLALLGIVGLILAVADEEPIYALVGVGLILVAIVYEIAKAQIVRVTKMDDEYIWLARVNREFLDGLPAK